MAKLGKVVYLTEAQKETLFSEGTVTVDGTTVTYSANDLYLTPTDSKVNKSGDTMTGDLSMQDSRLILTDANDNTKAFITARSGESTYGQFVVQEKVAGGSVYENYNFPVPDSASNKNFHVLTDKNTVTIEQGGTGATTAAAARTNLDAVAKTGDTMSGRLTSPNFRSIGSIMPYFSFAANSTDANDAGSILFNISSSNMMFM